MARNFTWRDGISLFSLLMGSWGCQAQAAPSGLTQEIPRPAWAQEARSIAAGDGRVQLFFTTDDPFPSTKVLDYYDTWASENGWRRVSPDVDHWSTNGWTSFEQFEAASGRVVAVDEYTAQWRSTDQLHSLSVALLHRDNRRRQQVIAILGPYFELPEIGVRFDENQPRDALNRDQPIAREQPGYDRSGPTAPGPLGGESRIDAQSGNCARGVVLRSLRVDLDARHGERAEYENESTGEKRTFFFDSTECLLDLQAIPRDRIAVVQFKDPGRVEEFLEIRIQADGFSKVDLAPTPGNVEWIGLFSGDRLIAPFKVQTPLGGVLHLALPSSTPGLEELSADLRLTPPKGGGVE